MAGQDRLFFQSPREKTEKGNLTLCAYVTLYLDFKQPGSLTLILVNRAVQCAAADAVRKKLENLVKVNP
jgi:hypothetical protein